MRFLRKVLFAFVFAVSILLILPTPLLGLMLGFGVAVVLVGPLHLPSCYGVSAIVGLTFANLLWILSRTATSNMLPKFLDDFFE
jgi:ABC-type Co2+ transport system permease subunit